MSDRAPLRELLPRHLAERAVALPRDLAPNAGDLVLYWMRTAMRGHENPALDAALELAAELGRPLLVYQGLAQKHPYASDRHYRFILEGARDVAAELAERGIRYVFHLERGSGREPHLARLARRAAAVVTELMPVEPLAGWTRSLARHAPLLAIDTACLVPMPTSTQASARAFEFRRATAAERAKRLDRPWPEVDERRPQCDAELPFEPLDLGDPDFADLLGHCRIDHTIGPVPHTAGGSRAGYRRWRAFRDTKLSRYAARRNDPLADGVSRLSPYLHYGMVSPLRLAREAGAEDSKGAEKFLDELLVWRELAYHFCFHQPDCEQLEALPAWAQETLAQHASDPRPALYSWETMARGRTGDRLWDAAQRSLVNHGELHNNLRMTWGKAVPLWTSEPAAALARLVDLNHRFALDGRDPASYGGLLWCLGLFDRPFPPPRPVLGTVRPRSSDEHARRLDLDAYERRVSRPACSRPPRVLVVGAGVAGLVCARALHDHGLEVEVVDKGRAASGRAATRRDAEHSFDHGAQYFTVRDRRFARCVRSWAADGVVAPWDGRLRTLRGGELQALTTEIERWVGVPGMSAVCRHLAADLRLESGRRVLGLGENAALGVTFDDGSSAEADIVVLALPAPQASALLPQGVGFGRELATVVMEPTWAVMVAFERPWEVPFDGAFVHDSALAWVARDSSKPGRPSGDRWVLHATPDWSRDHLEATPETAVEALLSELEAAVGRQPPPVVFRAGHRWRFAQAAEPLERECFFETALGIGVCGDWCCGSRIEGAFLSGSAMAGAILRRLT